MCQRHNSWHRRISASYQSLCSDRMMRLQESSLPYHPFSFLQFSCHTANFCNSNAFLPAHQRHNGRNPLCDHRFPAARRSDQQQVMKSCSSDLCSTLRHFLSAYIRKVLFIFPIYHKASNGFIIFCFFFFCIPVI